MMSLSFVGDVRAVGVSSVRSSVLSAQRLVRRALGVCWRRRLLLTHHARSSECLWTRVCVAHLPFASISRSLGLVAPYTVSCVRSLISSRMPRCVAWS